MLLGFWLTLIALLIWVFSGVLNERENPNRTPQTVNHGQLREVVLLSSRGGHYIASGEINRQPVTFLVDTGATLVSVPESLARELGLEKQQPILAQTANGKVQIYRTQLDSVLLGNIELQNVTAAINPGMNSTDKVLLGMSFLRSLELSQQDNTLRIRQYNSP